MKHEKQQLEKTEKKNHPTLPQNKKGEIMNIKNTIYYLLFIVFITSYNLHAGYEAFEDDIEDSKKIPLISKRKREEIMDMGQALITVCTTPLKGYFGEEYDHVYLVFEIQDAINPEEIKLFAVHFGGDGHSSRSKEDSPIYFDTRSETLSKALRGKTIDYLNSTDPNNLKYTKIKKIYNIKMTFPVPLERARKAVGKIYDDLDRDLHYDLSGGYLWGPNGYNCVTYANKILLYCDINIEFDNTYVLKNATNFLKYCENFLKNEQRKNSGKELHACIEYSPNTKEGEEEKPLVENDEDTDRITPDTTDDSSSDESDPTFTAQPLIPEKFPAEIFIEENTEDDRNSNSGSVWEGAKYFFNLITSSRPTETNEPPLQELPESLEHYEPFKIALPDPEYYRRELDNEEEREEREKVKKQREEEKYKESNPSPPAEREFGILSLMEFPIHDRGRD